MRVVIQRAANASIDIDGQLSGKMGRGLVVLFGVEKGDVLEDLDWIVNKCMEIRVFEDSEGKMNRSLLDIEGELLIVSQFTLYGNMKKGNRPSFNRSAPPDVAIPIYESFVRKCRERLGKIKVITGKFGAHMDVSLTNDGPVTILIDTNQKDF